MADYTVDEGESDMAMLSLNMNVDLSPIFNWNVKQLYVYLVAEYSTIKNVILKLKINNLNYLVYTIYFLPLLSFLGC